MVGGVPLMVLRRLGFWAGVGGLVLFTWSLLLGPQARGSTAQPSVALAPSNPAKPVVPGRVGTPTPRPTTAAHATPTPKPRPTPTPTPAAIPSPTPTPRPTATP